MIRLLSGALAVTVFLGAPRPAASDQAAEARALWVECEGTNESLSSKKKIDELIERARAAHVNLLYVQVFRHNRAWFNSRLSDSSPYREFLRREQTDPLLYLIGRAHQAGIQVHAWLNMFRIGKNPAAPVLQQLGPEAVTRDGTGRSLLDYPAGELPDGGYWLDPGDRRVTRYLQEVIQELLRKYPDLDGIHLDFVRYPYASPHGGSLWAGRRDFGYGAQSVERFKEWTGLDPLKMELNRANCQAWDNWRRFQVNTFVESVTVLARAIRPSLTVSAAVVAWADRAYLAAFQDWRRWLEEGLLDAVAVMNYTTDSRVARYLSRAAVLAGQGRRQVYIGIGEYLLSSSRSDLFAQLDDARRAGADGIVFFSYDSMASQPDIFKLLGSSRFDPPVGLPPMPWKGK